MRKTLFGLLLMSCVYLPVAPATEQNAVECANSKAQSAEVAVAVRRLFESFAANDASGIRAHLAPSFQLYEVELYDTEGLIKLVSGLHAKQMKPTWNLDELEAHAGCGRGWAKWIDLGTVTEGGNVKATRFLESAVLHREGGRWVIDFLHSTPLT